MQNGGEKKNILFLYVMWITTKLNYLSWSTTTSKEAFLSQLFLHMIRDKEIEFKKFFLEEDFST